jgi:hypothetical protein
LPVAEPEWVPVWTDVPFLLSNAGVNLDGTGPAPATGVPVQVYSGGGSVAVGSGTRVALLAPTEPATPAACAAKLPAAGVRQLALDTGGRFCVRTGAGRVALVTVLGRSGRVGWNVRGTAWRHNG